MTHAERAELLAIRARIDAMILNCNLLERLLPAIVGAHGSSVFSTNEILRSENRALREMVQHLTARRLGRLIGSAENKLIAGYMVERVGQSNVSLWVIKEVIEG